MADTAAHAASWLLQQHRERARFTPVANVEDIAGAYDVQERLVDLLMQAGEGAIAGYKIGLTTPRMQQMCGIDEPIAGVVLSKRVRRSPATIRYDEFVHLGIECELAVQLAQPITDTSAPKALRQSIGLVAPAFELVDDRHANYAQLDAGFLIADNSWNAGLVLGQPLALSELADLEGILEVNGETVDRGNSVSVLGDPVNAVAWLATHLATRGRRIEAGEWILTGSIVPTRFVQPGQQYRFSLGSLSPIMVTIE